MQNIRLITFLLMITVLGIVLLINNDIQQQKETYIFNCDIIRENSEYPVEKLNESGCITEDYLLSL